VRTPHLRCFAKQDPGEFSDGFHRFFVRRRGAALGAAGAGRSFFTSWSGPLRASCTLQWRSG
jgi:hypothetical protein